MKKKTLLIPISQTIVSGLWVLVFFLDFFAPPELAMLMVLHGICAVLGVVNAIVQWVRYQKDKAMQNAEG